METGEAGQGPENCNRGSVPLLRLTSGDLVRGIHPLPVLLPLAAISDRNGHRIGKRQGSHRKASWPVLKSLIDTGAGYIAASRGGG